MSSDRTTLSWGHRLGGGRDSPTCRRCSSPGTEEGGDVQDSSATLGSTTGTGAVDQGCPEGREGGAHLTGIPATLRGRLRQGEPAKAQRHRGKDINSQGAFG